MEKAGSSKKENQGEKFKGTKERRKRQLSLDYKEERRGSKRIKEQKGRNVKEEHQGKIKKMNYK